MSCGSRPGAAAAPGREPQLTVELDLQKPAEPGYRPSLKLRGLFEALFRGPRTQYVELHGPFGKDGVLVAQRFNADERLVGDHTLEIDVARGAERIAAQEHHVELGRR